MWILVLLSVTELAALEYKYKSPKSCQHLTVPTATAYKSLTVDWMLDCVRQCSHDSSCLSATFDGSQTCFLFSDDQLNCTASLCPAGLFVSKLESSTFAATTEDPVNTTSLTCLNSGTLDSATQTCKCYNGYIGDTCERIMMDCTEGFKSGHYNEDTYDDYFIKPTLAPTAFEIHCNMKNGGGGSTLMKNSEWWPFVNRNLNWNNYKDGFGSLADNHWLGLDKIHYITTSRPHHLFVEIFSDIDYKGRWRKYENFKVEDESTNYRMTYSGSFPWTQTEASADPDWSATIEWTPLGDSMIGLNGSAFSTFDKR
ncbi:hypothetical protein SNE40_018017 [Patella caerulea]|uniref:Uncharacterized protein n=1 Tax=Patella caerulea TaxID=87958 RepID=A0AAN8JBU7_PATCE